MPSRRSSISSALDAPQGRDAFSDDGGGGAGGAAVPARTTRRRRSKGPAWEENNKLRSFYCPQDLWDAIGDEVAKGERSKTQVIVDALRTELGMPEEDEA